MIWAIVVILVILWLIGAFGGRVNPNIPQLGGLIHLLIVIAIILVVLHYFGIVSF